MSCIEQTSITVFSSRVAVCPSELNWFVCKKTDEEVPCSMHPLTDHYEDGALKCCYLILRCKCIKSILDPTGGAASVHIPTAMPCGSPSPW